MANYLDNLTEYTSKTILVQADLAYEMLLAFDTSDTYLQASNIAWWQQLLTGANDTSQNTDLRLTLLTLLVDNARLNEVPLVNVFGLYQTLGDTTITATEWGLITGNINNQTDLIAKFALYLPLVAGTSNLLTGTLYFGADGLGMDVFNEGDTLNIGASAGIIQFGVDAEAKFGNITEGSWLATAIGIAKGGTGQTALGTAFQVLRVNSGATGTEWATITPGTGDVVGPGSATDNAIARFDTTTGKLIQNSPVVIGDTGIIVGPASIIFNGSTSGTITVTPVAIAGTRTQTLQALSGTLALSANKLDFFAATTSAELAGVISDETGTGLLVFNNTPTFITPIIGAATGTSLTTTGALTSGVASTTAGLLVLRNATNAFTQSIRGTGLAASRFFDLPIGDPSAGQILSGTLSGSTITLSWVSALSNPMSDIGDLIYGGVAGVATRLAGNTTPVRKFLVQTGTGSASNAPSWNIIDASDLPVVPLSKGGLGVALTDPNANVILGWDDANSRINWFVLGSGLSFNPTTRTISVSASGLVASVSGTTNEIDVDNTDPSNPIISMSPNYAGNSNLVLVGTIGSGTWEGSVIGYAFGGTGLSTLGTAGQVLATNAGATGMEWITVSGGGTPGGSNTEIQYNNSGAFGGVPDLVYTGGFITMNNPKIGTGGGNGHLHMRVASAVPSGIANFVTLFTQASPKTLGFIFGTDAFESYFQFSATADRTYTLPDKSGTVAMTSDIVPGGSDGQIQYNNAGAFAGDAGITRTTDTVNINRGNINVLVDNSTGTRRIRLYGNGGDDAMQIDMDAHTWSLVLNDAGTVTADGATMTFANVLAKYASDLSAGYDDRTMPDVGWVNSTKANKPTNTSFTAQTSVTVTHSKGYYPLVQVIDGSGFLISPLNVEHTSTNAFTVTFATSTTGVIINI